MDIYLVQIGHGKDFDLNGTLYYPMVLDLEDVLTYKNAFFAGIVAGLFVVDLDVLLDMGVLVGLVLAPGADTLVHVASFNTTLTVDVGYFLLNL